MEIKSICLYARVSRDNGVQDPENQLTEMRSYVARQYPGVPVIEYIDKCSGRTTDREEFKRMFSDARMRRYDLCIFWALDRWGRAGALATMQDLNTLTGYGIQWHSYKESYLSTLGDFRDAIVALLSTLAAQESKRLSERIRAGIQNKRRAKGLPVGRKATRDYTAIISRRAAGASYTTLAHEFNLSRRQIIRIARTAN